MRFSKVSKNTLFLFSTQVYNKLIGGIFSIIAARILGVSDFGKYALVITLLSFFYILSDWGLSTLTIREIAKSQLDTKKYLIYTMGLRLLLAGISFSLLFGLSIFLDYPSEITILITIVGLSIFPNNILNSFNSILNAYEKMYIPSIMCMAFNTIFLILGILCLHFGLGLLGLISIITFLSFINTILTSYFIRGFLMPLKIHFEYSFCKKIFAEATPFAILSALSIIYFRVDTIILSKIKTLETVGFYNAAYKIVEFLMFIPASLVLAYFPQMSRQAKSSVNELRTSYIKSVKYLLAFIIPIAISCSFFSKYIILILFGKQFLPSSMALKILIWAVVFMFINAPFGNILYNSKRIYKYIPFQILLTLLNIALNLILIPRWGYLGASYVTLITEIVAFIVQICFIRKILYTNG